MTHDRLQQDAPRVVYSVPGAHLVVSEERRCALAASSLVGKACGIVADALKGTAWFLHDQLKPEMMLYQACCLRPMKALMLGQVPRRSFPERFLAVRTARRVGLHRRVGHVLSESQFAKINTLDTPTSVRYVVQQHDAKRAGSHWDLRLHHQGTSLSWAIPKGRLPLVGQRGVLAIRQPDHEEAFSDWEGHIAEGEYGHGDVSKAAEGVADILKIDRQRGQTLIHMRLHGDLQGDYTLIQTNDKQWLWNAKAYQPLPEVKRHTFVVKNAEQIDRIEDECEGRCIAEVKVDGHHEIIHVTDHGLRLASHRLGKNSGVPIEHSDKVPHLRDVRMPQYEGTRMHGELYIKGQSAATVGGVLNSKVLRARDLQDRLGLIQVKVFDMPVFGKHGDISTWPYERRRLFATALLGRTGSPHIHYVRGQKSGFLAFYARTVAGQLFRYSRVPNDGIVVKRLDAPYQEDGFPWYKLKPSDSRDLTVIGVTEGRNGMSGTMGALTVLRPDGQTVQVGTGFKRTQRDWIWEHRDDVVGDVAKVKFHERPGSPWTGPRFKEFHPSKSEAGARMVVELAS